MLDILEQSFESMVKANLKGAYVASMGYLVSYPNEKLDMTKLEDFGFVKNEGVEIEFVKNDPYDFLITCKHVAGNTVYSIDADVNIEIQSER